MSIGSGLLRPRRDFSLRPRCCSEDCGLKVKSLLCTGEVAGEEHSDPERRSPAVSRLLSMISRAADFLRGSELEVLASILMDGRGGVVRGLCIDMSFEECLGDVDAFYVCSYCKYRGFEDRSASDYIHLHHIAW